MAKKLSKTQREAWRRLLMCALGRKLDSKANKMNSDMRSWGRGGGSSTSGGGTGHIPAATPVNKDIAAMASHKYNISLDQPIENENGEAGGTFGDMLEGDVMKSENHRREINTLMARTRDRLVRELGVQDSFTIPRRIEAYIAIFDGLCEGKAQTEIAAGLKISKERVNQLLMKLRGMECMKSFRVELKELVSV